jgi:fructokinase
MIVVAGESLIDLLVRPDGSVEAVPGGGPFNAARALARLGAPTAFVGRLSRDRFGRMLRDRLLADGVDLRWSPDTDDPTLLAIAELDDAGGATYRFHAAGSAAAGLEVADLPVELRPEVVAVHVGTLGLVLEPMATAVERLVGRAPRDAVAFLDVNARPAAIRDEPAYRARLDRVLGRADVVKASVDDLRGLSPTTETDAAAVAVLDRGPAAVLVTDGAGPVRVVDRAGIETVAVPAVPVVDTVGAGDAFGAAFLAWWHRHDLRRADVTAHPSLMDAARLAIRVGVATTTRAGADPPTASELGGLGPA